jgi:hypothetical protein
LKPSIILILFFTGIFIGVQGLAQPLTAVESVKMFLATLSPEELKTTRFSFEDSLRKKWTNLPVGLVPRPGIAYGLLSDQSRIAFHRVLDALLSSQGYLKTTSIMQLDDILNTLYQEAFEQGKINREVLTQIKDLKWAHGNYFISIWGEPQDRMPWGLNFGGHHMALSYTADENKISMSPYFIGTDPSEVKSSKYAGWRVLSKEEDYGFMLVNMLSEKQKSSAVLKQEVPKDIITNPNSSQRINEFYGASAATFNSEQKEMLQLLIGEYVHNFEHVKAHQLHQKILKTGLDKVHFAWIGSLENNKPHYYIVHGPDFLIEYDNVGFQNDGNHIHAIFREKGSDFGEDILKRHYLESKH